MAVDGHWILILIAANQRSGKSIIIPLVLSSLTSLPLTPPPLAPSLSWLCWMEGHCGQRSGLCKSANPYPKLA